MSAGETLGVGSTAAAQISRVPPHQHDVQFYRDNSLLIANLVEYFSGALRSGHAVLMIATQAHSATVACELEKMGFDLARLAAQKRYFSYDAHAMLAQFMVRGVPDAELMMALIGDVIRQAKPSSNGSGSKLSVFGEMVAILCAEGKHTAAVSLERLWNELAEKYCFSLRCAYPMSVFADRTHAENFMRICEEHSAVMPDETYTNAADHQEHLRQVAELQQKLAALEKQSFLQHSDQQLPLLVEAVSDYAIFMLDTEGRIRTWNSGAQRIKGYRASEIIGMHFSCFYPEEDIASNKPARELEIATREGRVEDEGWRLRKDGTKFWANVVITAIRDAKGHLIGFGKVTRDVTERMLIQRSLEQAQKKLTESERSLRQLSLHLLRTQDEERRRIGRDLHDSLGQNLAVLKMKLDSMLGQPEEIPAAAVAADLKLCAQLTDDAVKEVRTISYLLYPPMLEEMGLKSAIPWYLEGFTKRSGISTVFEISPQFKRLPSEVELALFRVLQESLTNVHRHSGSATATVRLMVQDTYVILTVSDEGHGVNSQTFDKAGKDWIGALGVGLRGMTERMHLVGGSLSVSSTLKGTTVMATVPLATAAAAKSNHA